jgi:hypothetical protein
VSIPPEDEEDPWVDGDLESDADDSVPPPGDIIVDEDIDLE